MGAFRDYAKARKRRYLKNGNEGVELIHVSQGRALQSSDANTVMNVRIL
jgi:hypothetical protein